MADLVTLKAAKDHLRITWADGDPRDADLQQKLVVAQAVVLTRCSSTPAGAARVATWMDPETTPEQVKHAILVKLAGLWRPERGDALEGQGPVANPPFDENRTIEALLRTFADPVLG